jgi:hypothetical protein
MLQSGYFRCKIAIGRFFKRLLYAYAKWPVMQTREKDIKDQE